MAQWVINTKLETGEYADISFRHNIIEEAISAGLDWMSKDFLVYQQLRWYETDGKFGFMVASPEHLTKIFNGATTRDIENCLNHLQRLGLIQHVWCDKKVYRNKTKVWISTVRLSACNTNAETVKVLARGGKNVSELAENPLVLQVNERLKTADPSAETADPSAETADPSAARFPVTTGVGNTNRNTNRVTCKTASGLPTQPSASLASEPSTDVDASLAPTALTCPTTSSSDSAKASSSSSSVFINDENSPPTEETNPFTDEIREVYDAKPLSLKPSTSDRAKMNREAAAIVKELMAICGVNGVVDSRKIKHIRSLLEHYSVDDLKKVAKWTTGDDFYKSKGFMPRFSHDACEAALASAPKSTRREDEGDSAFNIVY